MHRAVYEESTIVDYGRAVKDPPPELARYIVVRDQHCRWKGCDRPASWCHLHHVEWWHRDKGPTDEGNLVLLCARHHGRLHRKGWSAKLKRDGTLVVTTPGGDTWTTSPPGALRLPAKPRAASPFEEHLDDIRLETIIRRAHASTTRPRRGLSQMDAARIERDPRGVLRPGSWRSTPSERCCRSGSPCATSLRRRSAARSDCSRLGSGRDTTRRRLLSVELPLPASTCHTVFAALASAAGAQIALATAREHCPSATTRSTSCGP